MELAKGGEVEVLLPITDGISHGIFHFGLRIAECGLKPEGLTTDGEGEFKPQMAQISQMRKRNSATD